MAKPLHLSKAQVGLKHGFRSGLERAIAMDLMGRKVPFQFEKHTIRYEEPAKVRRYTPDFLIFNGIIIETKGRFVTADRQKHKIIKAQFPDLDVRFLFSNSRQRISKTSNTTYAMWCERYGFAYADKTVPDEWIKEPATPERWAALEAVGITR